MAPSTAKAMGSSATTGQGEDATMPAASPLTAPSQICSPQMLHADAIVIGRYMDDALATTRREARPRGRVDGPSGTTALPPSPITSAYEETTAAYSTIVRLADRLGIDASTMAETMSGVEQALTHPRYWRSLGLDSDEVRTAYATVHEVASLVVRVVMPCNKAAALSVWRAEVRWAPAAIAAVLTDLTGAQIKPNRLAMQRSRGNIRVSSRETVCIADCAMAMHLHPLPGLGITDYPDPDHDRR